MLFANRVGSMSLRRGPIGVIVKSNYLLAVTVLVALGAASPAAPHEAVRMRTVGHYVSWRSGGNHPDPSAPPLPGDVAGYSVAVSGSTAVVGAPGMANEMGIAYIYERSGTRWTREAVLPDPRKTAQDYYAWAVAISSTKAGTYVAVGGYEGNSDPDQVYIYEGSGKTWHRITIADIPGGSNSDMFGDAIAISATTLVVSASCVGGDSGTIYVYERFKHHWKLGPARSDPGNGQNDFFGQSVSISGSEMLVGAVDDAYVYADTPNHGWTRTATFQNPGSEQDNFGYNVALDGTKALIGAPGGVPGAEISSPLSAGSAYVYTLKGTTWSQSQELVAPAGSSGEEFGHSVAMNASTILVGMPVAGRVNCGSTVAFDVSGSKWVPNGQIVDPRCTSGDQFGFSVGLSGETAGIRAPFANQ